MRLNKLKYYLNLVIMILGIYCVGLLIHTSYHWLERKERVKVITVSSIMKQEVKNFKDKPVRVLDWRNKK